MAASSCSRVHRETTGHSSTSRTVANNRHNLEGSFYEKSTLSVNTLLQCNFKTMFSLSWFLMTASDNQISLKQWHVSSQMQWNHKLLKKPKTEWGSIIPPSALTIFKARFSYCVVETIQKPQWHISERERIAEKAVAGRCNLVRGHTWALPLSYFHCVRTGTCGRSVRGYRTPSNRSRCMSFQTL
jgi:hypothetical protein